MSFFDAAEAEVIVVIDSDEEEDREAAAAAAQAPIGNPAAAAQAQRASGRATGALRPRPAARPHGRRRPSSTPSRRQQQEQDDVVDLTGATPDYGDVQILSSTAGQARRHVLKRPRPQPLSPAKQALLAALLRPPPPPAPPPEPEAPGPKCGICMESMGGSEGRQMASGSCGHVYCRECLLEAVKKQKKCPTCRKTMQPKQIHNVFLSLS